MYTLHIHSLAFYSHQQKRLSVSALIHYFISLPCHLSSACTCPCHYYVIILSLSLTPTCSVICHLSLVISVHLSCRPSSKCIYPVIFHRFYRCPSLFPLIVPFSSLHTSHSLTCIQLIFYASGRGQRSLTDARASVLVEGIAGVTATQVAAHRVDALLAASTPVL